MRKTPMVVIAVALTISGAASALRHRTFLRAIQCIFQALRSRELRVALPLRRLVLGVEQQRDERRYARD